MTDQSPEIHAVVEVSIAKGRIWVELPPEPRPTFIRLSGTTPEDEVALLLGTLSSYGTGQVCPAQSADELAKAFPKILPGGFAVVGSERTVFPSCCCGLENWPNWFNTLSSGRGPWMGHDPSPLVEVLEGSVYVWSDGAFGEKPTSDVPLVFTPEQFAAAVSAAATDLQDFMIPLRAWLKVYAPRSANVLAKKFQNTFVNKRSPQ